MSRKHKKVLRKNITLIMCALIGTIVVVYGVGMILFRGFSALSISLKRADSIFPHLFYREYIFCTEKCTA